MYQMKRFEKHRTWIFYFTPAIYLVFIAVNGFMFAFSSQSYNDWFGPSSWIFLWVTLTSVHNYPILELTTFSITFQADTSIYFSTGLTLFHITPSTGDVGTYGEFAATSFVWPGFFVLPKLTLLLFSFCVTAMQTVFVLVFLVIVPLCNPAGNLWNLIDEATDALLQQTDKMSVVSHTLIPFSIFVPTDGWSFYFHVLVQKGLLLSINGITEGRITEKWMYSYSIPIVMLVSGLALSLQTHLRI